MFNNASTSEDVCNPHWEVSCHRERRNAKFYSLQDGFKDCDDISLERDRKIARYMYTICEKLRNEYKMLD
jgi:hypothetical protein